MYKYLFIPGRETLGSSELIGSVHTILEVVDLLCLPFYSSLLITAIKIE